MKGINVRQSGAAQIGLALVGIGREGKNGDPLWWRMLPLGTRSLSRLKRREFLDFSGTGSLVLRFRDCCWAAIEFCADRLCRALL